MTKKTKKESRVVKTAKNATTPVLKYRLDIEGNTVASFNTLGYADDYIKHVLPRKERQGTYYTVTNTELQKQMREGHVDQLLMDTYADDFISVECSKSNIVVAKRMTGRKNSFVKWASCTTANKANGLVELLTLDSK